MWTKTIKHLDGNIGENLYDLRFSDDFLDLTPKALPMKESTDGLNFIIINSLGKDTVKQATDRKKIFPRCLFNNFGFF